MIDTAADTTTLMRRAAQFLITEADARDADENTSGLVHPLKIVPAPREEAPKIDTAAIFGKQPAGLDGHGEAKTTAPVILTDVAALIAPPPPVILPPPAPLPPVASAGPAQSAAHPVERDSSGLPYDARIHQTARGKKRDGAWKNQKGLDPAVIAAVTAELRNTASVAGPALAPPPPPPAPTAPVAPPPPVGTANTSQPAPVPGASAQGSVTAFRELMQKITANTNTGKLTNVQVDAALQSVGLPARQLISLVQNPDKVADVAAFIDACLAAG